MKLKHLLYFLEENKDASMRFMLPSGEFIPDHFHVTEVGKASKTFIDCGRVVREEHSCVLQVWTEKDVDHRLKPARLAEIIRFSQSVLDNLSYELDVLVEYGEEAATTYKIIDLETRPEGNLVVVLSGKKTDCLAPDKCGINQSCCGEVVCHSINLS